MLHEENFGELIAGLSLNAPDRRCKARRRQAETDFTAVQRAGACVQSDVLTELVGAGIIAILAEINTL